MKELSTGAPRGVAKIAHELGQVICEATQLAALAASEVGARERGLDNKADHVSAVFTASHGLIGGLHILASLIGHHGDKDREQVTEDDVAKIINPTSTLLAAILLQAMAPSATMVTKDERGVAIDANISFSPELMLESVQQVERITGRPVDGYIRPGMLRSLRKIAENSDEPMNRFLAQRRSTPGNLH